MSTIIITGYWLVSLTHWLTGSENKELYHLHQWIRFQYNFYGHCYLKMLSSKIENKKYFQSHQASLLWTFVANLFLWTFQAFCMRDAQYSSLCFQRELLVLSYPGLSAKVVTLISSTLGGSSIGLPFLAKKSWVKASRMSVQKTLSSCISPFSGSVHRTIGMSMWMILNLLGLGIYKNMKGVK